MDFDDIERILQLVREHDLAEFELERDGLKVRVRKADGPAIGAGRPLQPQSAVASAASVPMAAVQAQMPAITATPPPEDVDLELAVVKSPIVGTFYRSADPGSAAFVEVGQRVKKDEVLCIIEAMKLMNEITSEYEGEIVSVYVDNGTPVQYGERLFAIRTG